MLDALRAAGHRVSAARRVVLQALFAADGPVSAEYIAAGLGGKVTESDVTSAYRALERLEALGVVRHVHLGHGPGLYALVGSGEVEYLACERCDRVTSVAPAELDGIREEVAKRFGYEARFSHFPILGLCPECSAAESRAQVDVSKRTSASERRRGAEEKTAHEHEHSHGGYIHSHSHQHPHKH